MQLRCRWGQGGPAVAAAIAAGVFAAGAALADPARDAPAGGEDTASAGASPETALGEVLEGYRAERAGTLGGAAPREVLLLPAGGPERWPADLRRDLEQRIVAEWNEQLEYGVVQPGVGARLAFPLVTARIGGRVVVPVVEGHELPVRGELDLLFGLARRRIALLVDTSGSTNAAHGRRLADEGGGEHPFPAEWRAVEQVYAVAAHEPVDVSVIAFGNHARAVVEPDTPSEEAETRVKRFRRENPRGHGRTDAICALWLGREWLEQGPPGVERHLVLLTDGAEPDSGRFPGCDLARRIGGGAAEWVCRLGRNRHPCPAARPLDARDGKTDWDQIENFAEELPEEIHLHALLFGESSDVDRYQLFADRADGKSRTVLAPAAIDDALLDVIGHQALGVFAENETTGRRTANLLRSDGRTFDGMLPLESGANDVAVRVENEGEPPTIFRFRVYAEPELRRDYLGDVRERNQALQRERQRLLDEASRRMHNLQRQRDLEITPD